MLTVGAGLRCWTKPQLEQVGRGLCPLSSMTSCVLQKGQCWNPPAN